MIHPGNASIAASQQRFGIRRALFIGTCAITAALTAISLAPAIAQTPAQAASGGGGARANTATDKTVKQSKPGKMGGRMDKMSKQKMMPPSRVVLVFPTDGKGGVSDQLADVITETIQGRIAASNRYQTVYFLRSIPTVTRALNEANLTANEVSHPFDDDTKLKKVMPYVGYDMALTTSVDSYTYDAAKNQVTLLISARLIDYRGAKPIVRAVAENGSSAASGGNAKELTLATQVAKSISEKLMTSLLSQEKMASQ